MDPDWRLTYGKPTPVGPPVPSEEVWFATLFVAVTLPDPQSGRLDLPSGAARFLPIGAPARPAAATRVFDADGIAIIALSGVFPKTGAKQIHVPIDAVSHALPGASAIRRTGQWTLPLARQMADNPNGDLTTNLESVRFRGRGWTMSFRTFAEGTILTAKSDSGQSQDIPILINADSRILRLLTVEEHAIVTRGGRVATPIPVPAKPTGLPNDGFLPKVPPPQASAVPAKVGPTPIGGARYGP
jgi:hypothetical protein